MLASRAPIDGCGGPVVGAPSVRRFGFPELGFLAPVMPVAPAHVGLAGELLRLPVPLLGSAEF